MTQRWFLPAVGSTFEDRKQTCSCLSKDNVCNKKALDEELRGIRLHKCCDDATLCAGITFHA